MRRRPAAPRYRPLPATAQSATARVPTRTTAFPPPRTRAHLPRAPPGKRERSATSMPSRQSRPPLPDTSAVAVSAGWSTREAPALSASENATAPPRGNGTPPAPPGTPGKSPATRDHRASREARSRPSRIHLPGDHGPRGRRVADHCEAAPVHPPPERRPQVVHAGDANHVEQRARAVASRHHTMPRSASSSSSVPPGPSAPPRSDPTPGTAAPFAPRPRAGTVLVEDEQQLDGRRDASSTGPRCRSPRSARGR